jgi:hypothetical protein
MKKQKEIWKDIPNYEGHYQVSNYGRVKSLERIVKNGKSSFLKKEMFLTLKQNTRGYLCVSLYKNNLRKTKSVHQLVAMAFLNHIPCGHKKVVDHINNIRTDNRLENLQIITTRKNNSKDRIKKHNSLTGVYLSNKKWYAQIKFNGKNYHLGVFKSELEAHKKYLKSVSEVDNKTFKPIEFKQKSKYKGVSFREDRQKWFSYIDKNKKRVMLGCFDTEEMAYNEILKHKNKI